MSDRDPHNPEWTEADFARAKGPDSLGPAELSAFRKTRGPQKAPKKVPVFIRLDPDIVAAFQGGGPGWQSRINLALREQLGRTPRTGAVIKVEKAQGKKSKAG